MLIVLYYRYSVSENVLEILNVCTSYFKMSFPPGNFNVTHKTCKSCLGSSTGNKKNNSYFFLEF